MWQSPYIRTQEMANKENKAEPIDLHPNVVSGDGSPAYHAGDAHEIPYISS
jgi:hypothetical protein